MPDSFSFQKLADSVAGSRQKLFGSVQNPFIKMKQSMLQIMQNKMHIQFVGVCPLSAATAKIVRYFVTAVFADDYSIYFMSRFFQRFTHLLFLIGCLLRMLKLTFFIQLINGLLVGPDLQSRTTKHGICNPHLFPYLTILFNCGSANPPILKSGIT